jgi:hypothetical protein
LPPPLVGAPVVLLECPRGRARRREPALLQRASVSSTQLFEKLKRRQSSSIACHSRQKLCGTSLGSLSGSYCILQSGKTSRFRPCAPSTPPQREASNFEQDCTRPVDGTANPWRGSAELYTLSPPSPCYPQPYSSCCDRVTTYTRKNYFWLLA